jgi:hypothetical protein
VGGDKPLGPSFSSDGLASPIVSFNTLLTTFWIRGHPQMLAFFRSIETGALTTAQICPPSRAFGFRVLKPRFS